MPTNLPPEAKDKWALVEATNDPKLKLQRYQEFLAAVPQHKGTMKLRGQIKKKMAVIRKDLDDKRVRRVGMRSGGPKFFIEKEGSAQIALLGMTNVGKSSLLAAVTNAKVSVSPVPYTSRDPVPSIMNYKDIQLQILETPAVTEGSADGKLWGAQTIASARNADGLILMVDVSNDPVKQLQVLLGELEKSRIATSKPKGKVEIDRKHTGTALRIVLVGKLLDSNMREVETLLRSYRINDAIVKISGEVALDDIEEAIFETMMFKPTLIVANKLDVPGAETNLRALEQHVQGKLPIIATSCEKKNGLDNLGEAVFKTMDIIRIYTKEPSKRDPSDKPFTLKRGSTLQDLAKSIHREFVDNFAYARVWGKRLVFSPQKVGLTFALEDGDIVEIHTK
ncbi:MAG: TGS domain-containing protein [Candidatus Bathyarchaeota archaeon]|nr:TGS domain-containing protein [Candidatus Bathyarchaeota archaeon]